MKTQIAKCKFKRKLSFCQSTPRFLAAFRATIRGEWKYAILAEFRYSHLSENTGSAFQKQPETTQHLLNRQAQNVYPITISIWNHLMIDHKTRLKKGKNLAKWAILRRHTDIFPHTYGHIRWHIRSRRPSSTYISFFISGQKIIVLRIKHEFLSE